MRILHVIGDLAPESGGPAKACVEMAGAVARRGHQVAIATTDYSPRRGRAVPPLVTEPGLTVHVHRAGFPRAWLTSWPLKRALEGLVREADVVHIHSLYLFHSWAAGTLCRRLGVPYIVRPHGTLDPYIHRRHRWRKRMMELWFQDRVLRDAAAIHYTSAEERRLAEAFVQGAPGAVVPLGLDLADYADLPPAGSFRARHPEIGDRPILLFLSRLNFKKGLDVLIEAAARTRAAGIDAHLVIAGPDGGMEAAAHRWVERAGLESRTSFTGMLTGRDKLAAYRDAALFLLPSSSENFGIAVIEAMACGTPVIVSDRVNIWREIVADGAGLTEPPQAAAFASAILRLLADEPMRRAMGRAGRDAVARRYQWSAIAADLERLYLQLSADRAAADLGARAPARC
jgi:glycosyltransferase involved in cell wall biosynthesis